MKPYGLNELRKIRCVEKCPSSLNIVKVIKAFEKEAANHE